MYLFIHLLRDILRKFIVLAIMNKAAENTYVPVFVWTLFLAPLGECQGTWLLVCMVRIGLTF